MAAPAVAKVCPVVVHATRDGRQILVFRHPLAGMGMQLVKGTIEPGEDVHVAALRELAEESGITDAAVDRRFGVEEIVPGQTWHFVLVQTGPLPDRWTFHTADDGGRDFAFEWWPLDLAPDTDWHPDSAVALAFIRERA